ncbi:hypothetical protein V8C86DRAFT_3139602 [Haematococcus lacustris]
MDGVKAPSIKQVMELELDAWLSDSPSIQRAMWLPKGLSSGAQPLPLLACLTNLIHLVQAHAFAGLTLLDTVTLGGMLHRDFQPRSFFKTDPPEKTNLVGSAPSDKWVAQHLIAGYAALLLSRGQLPLGPIRLWHGSSPLLLAANIALEHDVSRAWDTVLMPFFDRDEYKDDLLELYLLDPTEEDVFLERRAHLEQARFSSGGDHATEPIEPTEDNNNNNNNTANPDGAWHRFNPLMCQDLQLLAELRSQQPPPSPPQPLPSAQGLREEGSSSPDVPHAPKLPLTHTDVERWMAECVSLLELLMHERLLLAPFTRVLAWFLGAAGRPDMAAESPPPCTSLDDPTAVQAAVHELGLLELMQLRMFLLLQARFDKLGWGGAGRLLHMLPCYKQFLAQRAERQAQELILVELVTPAPGTNKGGRPGAGGRAGGRPPVPHGQPEVQLSPAAFSSALEDYNLGALYNHALAPNPMPLDDGQYPPCTCDLVLPEELSALEAHTAILRPPAGPPGPALGSAAAEHVLCDQLVTWSLMSPHSLLWSPDAETFTSSEVIQLNLRAAALFASAARRMLETVQLQAQQFDWAEEVLDIIEYVANNIGDGAAILNHEAARGRVPDWLEGNQHQDSVEPWLYKQSEQITTFLSEVQNTWLHRNDAVNDYYSLHMEYVEEMMTGLKRDVAALEEERAKLLQAGVEGGDKESGGAGKGANKEQKQIKPKETQRLVEEVQAKIKSCQTDQRMLTEIKRAYEKYASFFKNWYQTERNRLNTWRQTEGRYEALSWMRHQVQQARQWQKDLVQTAWQLELQVDCFTRQARQAVEIALMRPHIAAAGGGAVQA